MTLFRCVERFPIYRRSKDGRHAYRIEGLRAFTEVQSIGSRSVVHRIREAAYPEQLRIREMMDGSGAYPPLDPDEFDRLLSAAEKAM